MKRQDLIEKIKERKQALNIPLRNLATLSKVSYRTLTRFLAGDDIRFSGVEKITQFLGLDFAGSEEVDIQTVKEKRALEKAKYIVGLVQDTSSLENQGLDKQHIEEMIEKTKQEFLTGKHQNKLWST